MENQISRQEFIAGIGRYAAGVALLGLTVFGGCGNSDSTAGRPQSIAQPARELDALLADYSRAQAGGAAERQAYLDKAKDVFKLGRFLEVCYQPEKGKRSDRMMETWPARQTERGVAIVAACDLNGLLGNDSACIVFDDAFKHGYYDFMSVLADHEHAHAEIWKNGIGGNSYYITDRITTAEKSGLAIDLFCAMSEIIACHDQLEKGRFSGAMSEDMKRSTRELYAENIKVIGRLSDDAFADKVAESWPIVR